MPNPTPPNNPRPTIFDDWVDEYTPATRRGREAATRTRSTALATAEAISRRVSVGTTGFTAMHPTDYGRDAGAFSGRPEVSYSGRVSGRDTVAFSEAVAAVQQPNVVHDLAEFYGTTIVIIDNDQDDVVRSMVGRKGIIVDPLLHDQEIEFSQGYHYVDMGEADPEEEAYYRSRYVWVVPSACRILDGTYRYLTPLERVVRKLSLRQAFYKNNKNSLPSWSADYANGTSG